jgi:hypothetical protein
VGAEQKLFVSNLEASMDRSINRLLMGMALLGLGVVVAVIVLTVGYRAMVRR